MTETTPSTDDLTYLWPEEGIPSFVSFEGGADGTWVPLCDLHEGMVPLEYRFTPWGSHHCPSCGVTHLIWAEDWPDYVETCDAEDCDVPLDDGEGYDGLCGDHADEAEAAGVWA